MKTIHWITLSVVFILATWFIYQTRETENRFETSIDLNWRFILGDPEGAADPGFIDSEWAYVSLPHDWMIEQPVNRHNASNTAGGFYPSGVAWYRKTLDVSEHANKEQFYLLFDGVMQNADVYINGIHLGFQEYGYTSFYHDISSLLRFDTLNVIAVRADCSNLPVDRWYAGGGIYRHVKLIATSALHIPVWGTLVTSTLDSTGVASLNVAMDILNMGKKAKRFEVHYDIVDPRGRIVADGNSSEFLEASEEKTIENTFRIEDPGLWSPEQPQLYSVNCFLMEKNKQIDLVKTIHGIRTIDFDPDRGFILNGEKVMMKGVCLHHDGGALGAAIPLESWKRRFQKLKKLGVNALRLAHNPHAPEVLDLCDQMGFLVINEIYDKWEEPWFKNKSRSDFEDFWEENLTKFVLRDRNHPSLVLWSLGNETKEQLSDPALGVEWYQRLKQVVNTLDPTREVTCALHPGYADRGNEIPSSMMFVSPVVSYNYRTDSFKTWHEQYPDLVFIASETKVYGPTRKEDYQVIDFSDNSWNEMEEFVAGQFIWAGIDYLGESAGWPDRGWKHSLMQTSGFIEPHAWYIASQYREDPMVKLTVKDSLLADSLNRIQSWQAKWIEAPLVDHWTFFDDSLHKEVVIFTNCDRVELKVNNRVIKTLQPEAFPDGVVKTWLKYEPGELVAHGFFEDDRGKTQKVSDTLVTAADAYALAMNPDRGQISSNGRKLVHITTEVVDSTGVLNPHSRHQVNYKLDGPGRIRAIDNGDLADHSRPDTNSRQVRQGKQLLILQAGSEPGDLIISATAEGLRPSSVKIKSK